MEQLTITLAQTRERLGLGRTKTHQLVRAGEFEKLTVGRRVLITASSVSAFIERRLRATRDGER